MGLFSPQDKAAIVQAIATGASEVALPDRRTTLRSLSEIRQILAMIETDEARQAGVTRTRAVRFVTDKGL